MDKLFYSATEVCKLLGTYKERLYYHEMCGHVPKPKRVGHHRFYTQDDLLVLQRYFGGIEEYVRRHGRKPKLPRF
jgi:DNA-binding transcriptional MerR regulator